MEPRLHGDPRERVVVDQRRPEVGEAAGLDAGMLGKEVTGD